MDIPPSSCSPHAPFAGTGQYLDPADQHSTVLESIHQDQRYPRHQPPHSPQQLPVQAHYPQQQLQHHHPHHHQRAVNSLMADAFGSLEAPAAQCFGESYNKPNGVDPPALVNQWQPNKPIIPVPSVHHQQQQQLIHQFQPSREEREKFFDQQRQTLQLLQQHHTEQMQRLDQLITSYRLQLSQASSTTTATDTSPIALAQPSSDPIENEIESAEKSPQQLKLAQLGGINSTGDIPRPDEDFFHHNQLQPGEMPQCRPVSIKCIINESDVTTAVPGSFCPFKLKFFKHFLDRNGFPMDIPSGSASLFGTYFKWMINQNQLGKDIQLYFGSSCDNRTVWFSGTICLSSSHYRPSRHHAPHRVKQCIVISS